MKMPCGYCMSCLMIISTTVGTLKMKTGLELRNASFQYTCDQHELMYSTCPNQVPPRCAKEKDGRRNFDLTQNTKNNIKHQNPTNIDRI